MVPGNGTILQLMDNDECGMNAQNYVIPVGEVDVYKEGRNLSAADPENDVYPHHIYGKDERGHYQLCVHYHRDKNWNQQMFIAESFIPWVCTWLNTYEYWLITGEWHYDEVFSK